MSIFASLLICISSAYYLSPLPDLSMVYASEADGDPDVADDGTIRICIDPGHGGENEGALWDDYVEKEMTMITASAMRDELAKYDGIEVYMTRTEDAELSLEERVEYASENDCDFFFCLHYNMSADHDMYGSECWISAFGENYARGYDFASIEMELLTSTGLYDRGIKTRLNSKGTNYYGVLRVADIEGLPGVIIEHCHLDHDEDQIYYDHREKLEEFGRIDATAVAMYYGLRSDELGVDYSDYTYDPTPVPNDVVRPDDTGPEYVTVKYGEVYETQNPGEYAIDAQITSHDPDCRELYYCYSVDGGATWSARQKWISTGQEYTGDETIDVTIPLPTGRNMELVIKAYNLYNLSTDSSAYTLPGIMVSEPEPAYQPDPETGDDYTEIDRDDDHEVNDLYGHINITDKGYLIMLGLMSLSILVLMILMVNLMHRMNRDRRRRNRRSAEVRGAPGQASPGIDKYNE